MMITLKNYLYVDKMQEFAASLQLSAHQCAVYYDDNEHIIDKQAFFSLLGRLVEHKRQYSEIKFKTGILGCTQLTAQEQQQSFMLYDVCRYCNIVKECKGRPSFVNTITVKEQHTDILFVQPSYQPHWSCCEPTGLLTLAGYVCSKGFSAKIIDLNVHKEQELFTLLALHHPKIVGLTMLSRQADRGYILAEKIKKQCPKTIIVIGGVHPTICPHDLQDKSYIDYVVIGEGELSFEKLCNYVIKGTGNLEEINGIMYRDNNSWKSTGSPELIDLDHLPLPAYDLVDLSVYNTNVHVYPFHKEPAVHMMTSRGCPYNCTYCTSPFLYNHKVRFQSPERIMEELKHIKDTYGITRIHFHDDDFLLHKPNVKQLCRMMIEQELDVRWICLSNIKTIVNHLDMLPLIKEAGCLGVEFGVESGDERVLKSIGKVHTNADVISVRKAFNKYGIIFMHLLIGYSVGETIDSPYKTMKLLYEGGHGPLHEEIIPPFVLKDAEVMGHLARPSPATAFFDDAQQQGMIFALQWEDQYEERINFLPYSLLSDIPQPNTILNKEKHIASYKECIQFYIDIYNQTIPRLKRQARRQQ